MKKTLATIAISIVLLVCLVACGSSGPVKIKLSKLDTVQIHTELQASALADDYTKFATYAGGVEELSSPQPFVLEWTATDSKNVGVDSYKVLLSMDKDMADSKEYTSGTTSVTIWNLYAGKTYYYTVQAISNGQVVGSASSSFKTDGTLPRNIHVDGVTNVRDNGGYKTVDGNTVKQGLLYRGGRLNENISNQPIKIQPDGIDTMLNDLGIKTEIDLRESTGNGGLNGKSVLGDSVKYENCEMVGNSPYLMKINFDSIVQMFEILAHEENYPIYYHCSIGTDRTGMMSFFILAILGVDEADVYSDYLFSNFGNIGRDRTYQEGKYFFTYIKNMGETLRDQAWKFLTFIGVPEENLQAVVRIMTEYKK